MHSVEWLGPVAGLCCASSLCDRSFRFDIQKRSVLFSSFAVPHAASGHQKSIPVCGRGRLLSSPSPKELQEHASYPTCSLWTQACEIRALLTRPPRRRTWAGMRARDRPASLVRRSHRPPPPKFAIYRKNSTSSKIRTNANLATGSFAPRGGASRAAGSGVSSDVFRFFFIITVSASSGKKGGIQRRRTPRAV